MQAYICRTGRSVFNFYVCVVEIEFDKTSTALFGNVNELI